MQGFVFHLTTGFMQRSPTGDSTLEVKVGRPLFFTNEERVLIEKHLTEAAHHARGGHGNWRKLVIDNVGVVNRLISTAIHRSHQTPPDSRAERVDPFAVPSSSSSS